MILTLGSAAVIGACGGCIDGSKGSEGDFKYLVDEFADIKIMRFQIPGWDKLSLQQKEYVYHLSEAAKYGWDIHWDQNFKYNLKIRKALESILTNYTGDKECK